MQAHINDDVESRGAVVVWCVNVLRPTNSYGYTETGPRFKVSSERLEKPGIELTTPGLQGEWLNHYTTEASVTGCNVGLFQWSIFSYF